MKRLAVFCGSAIGASPVYVQGAIALGKEFVERDVTLVYGGSVNGLMGIIADTVLEQGGKAIGVLPDFLRSKELAHPGLTELIPVSSMHERKAKMAELADGFVVLPGGVGTMDEFFEIFTWAQLGLHQKPCGILNIQHYYDPLIALFQHMSQEQFLQEKFLTALLVHEHPKELLDQFQHYNPPTVKTFITHRQQI